MKGIQTNNLNVHIHMVTGLGADTVTRHRLCTRKRQSTRIGVLDLVMTRVEGGGEGYRDTLGMAAWRWF